MRRANLSGSVGSTSALSPRKIVFMAPGRSVERRRTNGKARAVGAGQALARGLTRGLSAPQSGCEEMDIDGRPHRSAVPALRARAIFMIPEMSTSRPGRRSLPSSTRTQGSNPRRGRRAFRVVSEVPPSGSRELGLRSLERSSKAATTRRDVGSSPREGGVARCAAGSPGRKNSGRLTDKGSIPRD